MSDDYNMVMFDNAVLLTTRLQPDSRAIKTRIRLCKEMKRSNIRLATMWSGNSQYSEEKTKCCCETEGRRDSTLNIMLLQRLNLMSK